MMNFIKFLKKIEIISSWKKLIRNIRIKLVNNAIKFIESRIFLWVSSFFPMKYTAALSTFMRKNASEFEAINDNTTHSPSIEGPKVLAITILVIMLLINSIKSRI